MEPEEKAKELLDKYQQLWGSKMHRPYAKQCALIAIEEIMEALEYHTWQNKDWVGYYQEVKQEIEKL